MEKRDLILTILITLEEGREPTFNELGVDKDFFGDTVDMMQNDELISNASVSRGGIGNKVAFVTLKHAKVEIKGLEYIENNKK